MRTFTHMLLQAAAGYQGPVTGQSVYSIAGDGSVDFIVPAGVTSISAVCVGPGYIGDYDYAGRGGGLAYGNNIPVTPGQTLTCQFGYSNFSRLRQGSAGGTIWLYAEQYPNHVIGGPYFTGGGYGGVAGVSQGFGYDLGGAGGAAGYTGNGGAGGQSNNGNSGFAGTGGGGGGGARATFFVFQGQFYVVSGSGAGGGVGLLGQGANGAGGIYYGYNGGILGGGGGSGGGEGGQGYAYPVYDCCGNIAYYDGQGGAGGNYGGGGGARYGFFGPGAIRIIWPGNTRSFPNTNTGNL